MRSVKTGADCSPGPLAQMSVFVYNRENRDVAEVKLKDLRPMKSLFEFIE